MGVTQSAGLSLQWMRDNFGGMEQELSKFIHVDPYDLMTKEAEQAEPGSQGLIYLPYLMGERTPHLDPYARGVFFGLTAKHNRSHMIRSVMEGVVYSLKDCLEIIKEMDVPIQDIRASGGGSRSDLWRQMQADVFNTPITTISSSEGPALGAALLAGVGAGIYSNVNEACTATIEKVDRSYPIEHNTLVYNKYYIIYRQLYKALEEIFQDVFYIQKDLNNIEV